MKKNLLSILFTTLLTPAFANPTVIRSPDNNLRVNVGLHNGKPIYTVSYKEKPILEESPLGLITNISDFSSNLTLVKTDNATVHNTYNEPKIKKSDVEYHANKVVLTFETNEKNRISIIFQVSNNNIAFKYSLPQTDETARCIVKKEVSGFKFPSFTTTFLTPQATPMIGWMRTKPSYEEEYVPDQPIATPSLYGIGYTFPGLFHVGDHGWALVSETGVDSRYCGSKLSEGSADGLYTISFPEEGENNGLGNAQPGIPLPGETPWRTITVGDNLKPIVETTIATDLVEPLYQPSQEYRFGRSTWSWLLWQDESINFDDQKTYIELSAEMGYEMVLIDNWWDTRIGREKIEELARYADSKNVGICLV